MPNSNPPPRRKQSVEQPKFIDLFSGCGGLSLGLAKAGWRGIFSIEKSPDAFATFKRNFCERRTDYEFLWPSWLPCQELDIKTLLKRHEHDLKKLRGEVDLIAGGPPCQGFSFAGRRNPRDSRNRLIHEYIETVRLVRPKYLILENVRGFQHAFPREHRAYSEKVLAELNQFKRYGYRTISGMVGAARFGVPQPRHRFIMIAIRKDLGKFDGDLINMIEENSLSFCKARRLGNKPITVRDAISDLEIRSQKLKDYDSHGRFKKITYTGRRHLTPYQKLMRRGVNRHYEPNSLRLPNHKPEIVERFQEILRECPRGVSLSSERREMYGLKKQCFTPLHPNKLARTVTTLPDDMIHYSEPRILTVRENARLQTFPDWFEFDGKYTTGGHRRKHECPRYSQVGNAVPPLLAEAIGEVLMMETQK